MTERLFDGAYNVWHHIGKSFSFRTINGDAPSVSITFRHPFSTLVCAYNNITLNCRYIVTWFHTFSLKTTCIVGVFFSGCVSAPLLHIL